MISVGVGAAWLTNRPWNEDGEIGVELPRQLQELRERPSLRITCFFWGCYEGEITDEGCMSTKHRATSPVKDGKSTKQMCPLNSFTLPMPATSHSPRRERSPQKSISSTGEGSEVRRCIQIELLSKDGERGGVRGFKGGNMMLVGGRGRKSGIMLLSTPCLRSCGPLLLMHNVSSSFSLTHISSNSGNS